MTPFLSLPAVLVNHNLILYVTRRLFSTVYTVISTLTENDKEARDCAYPCHPLFVINDTLACKLFSAD